jgi:Fe-S-cluster containining protein
MGRKSFHPPQQVACGRCGACCRKGGPCLHLQDREIIERGEIPLSDLFTIRRGEPAWDNVGGCFVFPEEDIIKIRSRPRTSICRFFNDEGHSCAVYESRPVECRVLQCRDIQAIVAVYDKSRLQRQDLLEERPALWEMASAHQEMCDYGRIGRLVSDKNMEELAYLVRYDSAFRDLAVEKKFVAPLLLDFLFGCPLTMTIQRYGISLPGLTGAASPRG